MSGTIYESSKNNLIRDIDERARNEYEFKLSGDPEYAEYAARMANEATILANETELAADRAVRARKFGDVEYESVWGHAAREEAARTPSAAAIKRSITNESSLEIAKTNHAVAQENASIIDRVNKAANKAIAAARARINQRRDDSPITDSGLRSPRDREGGRRMSYRSQKMKNHKKSKSYKKIRRGKRTKRRRY